MKDIIVQMFGILLPILLYQMLWNEQNARKKPMGKHKFFIAALAGISLLLCMTYPVKIAHFNYDLREIPLFLSILYGGYAVGIGITLLMLGYRILLWHLDGIFLMLLANSLVLPLVFYCSSKFSNYCVRQRIRTAAWLGFLVSLLLTALSALLLDKAEFPVTAATFLFFLSFILIHLSGMPVTVFLLEKSRERTELLYELQAAEKLRVVSQLAASIAHEIRNPLTVIRGFMQMLVNGELSPDKKQMYAQIVISELDRAQVIITDYLTFARPDPELEHSEHTNVKMAIENAVNLMMPFGVVHGAAIETTLEENLFIQADTGKFTQVIINLIKNAIESMPQGGVVTVRSSLADNCAAIRIQDEGIGMSKDQLDKLGDPFYSTKDKGTGLGLMVCKQIIQSLRGEIRLTSEPGQGTQVHILIPGTKVPSI